MGQQVISGDLLVLGNVSVGKSAGGAAGSVTLPSGCVADNQVAVGAGIGAGKTIQQQNINYAQAPGAAVAAATLDLYVARNAGTITGLQAAVTGVKSTGGDSVSVDLQRSTGGGAFATVLTGTLAFNSTATLRVATSASLSATTFAAGDIFRVVVTVSGTSTQGLIVVAALQEVGG